MLKYQSQIQKKHCRIVRKLSSKGIVCNITALFTTDQVKEVYDAIDKSTPSILSVFAGRIADTGKPSDIIKYSVDLVKSVEQEVYGQVRETLNIFQAEKRGNHRDPW